MNSLAIFCVLGLFGGLTLAAPSSRLPNNLFYIVNLTIAENDAKIDYYSVQVNLTENIFERFTQSLLYKNKLISRTLFVDERNLTNSVFLNFTNTNCMIENDRLPELALVQGSINECVKNATEDGSWMFTSVKYTLKQAREENNYIRRTIDTCVTSYPSGYKLTDCVNDRLQRGNKIVWDLLYKTDKDIQVALDEYDNIGRQAMECTFNVVENFSRDIEDVLRSLEKCKK